MSRRSVVLPVVGWLLGLLTVIVWPDLLYEREILMLSEIGPRSQLASWLAVDWTLERSQRVTDEITVVEFRRPRYMRVVYAVRRFWEDLMVRTGAAPPRTPTPAPKPTEAPKPAQPAASPRVP